MAAYAGRGVKLHLIFTLAFLIFIHFIHFVKITVTVITVVFRTAVSLGSGLCFGQKGILL